MIPFIWHSGKVELIRDTDPVSDYQGLSGERGLITKRHEESFWCDEHVLKVDCVILKFIQLYTFKRWILFDLNYNSINSTLKLLFCFKGPSVATGLIKYQKNITSPLIV